MRKKIVVLPCTCAAVCLMAAALMGASADPGEETVEHLLKQRTAVMSDMLFNRITAEEGEKRLEEIECGALWEKDMRNIETFEDTDAESVENIDVVSVQEKGRVYDTIDYEVKIQWDIAGVDGIYSSTDIYSVGVLCSENEYRLTSLELQRQ